MLVTVCYILTDPFQDMPFHAYHEFNILMLSRGDISTKVYLRNRNKYKYNSFIFGSSRSTAHTSVNWEHYLDKNDRAFSFGAWNESVVGVYKRLKLIDSLKDSIKNAFIILDEAQNTNDLQIKMFLTRIGANAKAIITGDPTQVDLPKNQRSGLEKATRILRNIDGIGHVELDEEDVVRHRLVKAIIKAYDKDFERQQEYLNKGEDRRK